MRSLRDAVGCLTVMPCRAQAHEGALGAALAWFPLVGLAIGAALVAVHRLADYWLPTTASAACTLLAWVAVTGGLHLDGVADVCDGLAGGSTPQARVRIMRDPHVGAMAVIGVCGVLVAKFALLASVPSTRIAPTLLLSPCLGRYAMVMLAATSRPATPGNGLAASWMRSVPPHVLPLCSTVTITAGWFLAGPRGLIAWAASIVCVLVLRDVCRRRFGGITGDALGAVGELVEVVVLLVMVASRA